MRLEDKNKIIETLYANRQKGSIGMMYGPFDSACALGHIYEAFGISRLIRNSDLTTWTSMVANLVEDLGLQERYEYLDLAGPSSLINIIIYMNDDLWDDLDVIADWIQDNVIPDDAPDTVPTEWEVYETV